MSITLGEDHIVQLRLRQEESICCGMRINRFTGFFYSTWSMNEGSHINLGHWIPIITTIPEISYTDHSCSRTTDKRIRTAKIKLSYFRNRSKLEYVNRITIVECCLAHKK